MRQNETTGAPLRSDPKLGNACAYRPSSNAASDSISAAVTIPCPPRPWIRTWNMSIASLRDLEARRNGVAPRAGLGKLRSERVRGYSPPEGST